MRLDLPEPEFGENRIVAARPLCRQLRQHRAEPDPRRRRAVGIVPGTRVELEHDGERYYAVAARTFADARAGDVILYEDSYRNMSVAITSGNAAAMLHARAGELLPDQRRRDLTCVLGAVFAVLPAAQEGVRGAVSPSRTSFPCAEECGGRRVGPGTRRLELRRATRRSRASPSGRPDEPHADWGPGPVQASGSEAAGWPVTLKAAVKGVSGRRGRLARAGCSGSAPQPSGTGWQRECWCQQQAVTRPRSSRRRPGRGAGAGDCGGVTRGLRPRRR